MGILGFEGYLRERGVFFFDVDDFVRLRAVGLTNAAAAATSSDFSMTVVFNNN